MPPRGPAGRRNRNREHTSHESLPTDDRCKCAGNRSSRRKPRSRYEFDLGGHTAYIDYEKDNGTIVLTHTFVPEAYEGRGVGAQLVAAALTDIRRQGLKVVPQCSFVAVYIKRHPEWSDMVSETAGAER